MQFYVEFKYIYQTIFTIAVFVGSKGCSGWYDLENKGKDKEPKQPADIVVLLFILSLHKYL